MRTAKPEPAPKPSEPLPTGWVWGRIEDVVGPNGVYIDGDWVESKDQDPDGDVRLIQLADVGDGYYVNKSNRFLTAAKARELGCTFLQAGDVLIARMPDPLGRACIFPGDKKQAVTVVDVCIARSGSPDVDHQWLMHAINAPAFRSAIGFLQSGSTRARISRGNLSTLWLPVAPSKEQQRIVAALDERLSELDASVAALERAERNLVRYRAAVLAAACSGRLVPTEADLARDRGPVARIDGGRPSGPRSQASGYEPADQLLARILAERRTANTKAKYEEPAQPDTSKLPKLPEGWVWAHLSQVAWLSGGLTKGQKRKEGQKTRAVPYLRVANVQRGHLDLDEVKNIEATSDEIDDLRLVRGDILFNEGGDRDKLGRGWIWESQLPECVHQNHVFRARIIKGLVNPLFVAYYSNWPGASYFETHAKQTTNLASINLTKLAAFPVPLPPQAEQSRIVAEVDRHCSRADALAAAIAQAKRRAARLRRAILAAAFQGRLVPQDPNDEPASVLLERIRTQAPPPGPRPTGPQSRRASGPRSQGTDDTPAPKRRGRPPGSTNKAKA